MSGLSGKLAQFAAPTRGRVKYAPLTSGLLARKGEAVPATPYFAAEALDLYAADQVRHQPATGVAEVATVTNAGHGFAEERRTESHRTPRQIAPLDEHRHADQHSYNTAPWRPRQPVIAPAEHHVETPAASKQPATPIEHAQRRTKPEPADATNSSVVEHAQRVSITLDVELAVLARLALQAGHLMQSPGRVIEEALEAHFAAGGDVCPACARSLRARGP
jgi:hypothetical protein